MSNSSLVSYTRISPNKNSPRNHTIDTITIHCVVAQWTGKQIADYFASSSVQASCNYGVGKDGSISLVVDEGDRSWCSSSSSNDNRAITIEVASDRSHPYAVTADALNALIKLCADICKRNGIKKLLWKNDKSLIGQVDKQNMTVHRWFANKACPGDYLMGQHTYIANEVNKLLGSSTEPETPVTPPEGSLPGSSGSVTTPKPSVSIDNSNKNFKDEEEKLKKTLTALQSRDDFTTFVKFTVNNLVLDTRVNDPSQQYVVSLKNEKNGSGKANKFTLTVTFTNYDTYSIQKFEDDFLENSDSTTRNLCTLEYGYVRTPNFEELSSPPYNGILLDFDMSIKDNFITYTFTGYSGFEVGKDYLVQWYPGTEILRDSKIDKETYKTYIENLSIAGDPLTVLKQFTSDLSKMSDMKYKYSVKVLDDELTHENALRPIAVSPCVGKPPVDYINYLLSMFVYEEAQIRDSWINDLNGITPTVSYTIKTIEEGSKPEVLISLYLRKRRDPIAEFSLNSGNPLSNDLLIDFDVNVDGSVVLAIDQSTSVEEPFSQVITSSGKVMTVSNIFNVLSRSARTSLNQNTFNSNIMSNKFDFEQTANATLVGLPCEIPIGTVIKLNSYIGNELHRISGNFFVESTVDTISTGGFFTTSVSCLRLESDTDLLTFNRR